MVKNVFYNLPLTEVSTEELDLPSMENIVIVQEREEKPDTKMRCFFGKCEKWNLVNPDGRGWKQLFLL